MDGIVLKRPEFLVLLDAVKAKTIVGLTKAGLFPSEEGEYRALIHEGIDMLKQRGWLRIEGNINVLNTDLLAMAAVVAYPQLAVITTRDTPEVGQQLFLHYEAKGAVVEQTFPEEQSHRFAVLPNPAALIQRLQAILPLPDKTESPQVAATLSQEVFLKAKEYVEEEQSEKAVEFLAQGGLERSLAQLLVESLREPVLGGTTTFLRCQKGEVVEARNVALVQGKKALWAVTQPEPGVSNFRVETMTTPALNNLLRQWHIELMALAPAKA